MSTSQLPRLSARAHRAAALALAASVGALLAAVTGGCGTSCGDPRRPRPLPRPPRRHRRPARRARPPLELANDLAARRFQRLRSPASPSPPSPTPAPASPSRSAARLVPAAEPGLVGVVVDVTVVDDAPMIRRRPAAPRHRLLLARGPRPPRLRPRLAPRGRLAPPRRPRRRRPQLEERGRAEVRAWLRDVLPTRSPPPPPTSS
ncbi:MAG: hypothetical protein R3B82_24615 [Sandaracinaceae bacterium]